MNSDTQNRAVLGLGSKSTEYYLSRIHQKYKEQMQEFSTCPLLLYQVDFQEINPYLPNIFSDLKPILKQYLNNISALRISKVLVPNITLHETLDQLESPLKICHAVDLTLELLVENKIEKVALFGTLYTMNSKYFKKKFNEKKIEIFLPTVGDQKIIDNFRKKVYSGKQTVLEIEQVQKLQRKYSKENPVVIACTELSIFSVKNEGSVIDMAELQIDSFLK